MLQQNQDDIANIWKIIKQVRKIFLSHNDDPKCQEYDNQIAEDDIKANVDNVEENLITKSTDYDSHENITDEILQIGAEMFTYLNFCPPKKLIKFYKELLLQRPMKDIILAMTNIMKMRRNAEKSSAAIIWSKIDKKLRNLKYGIIDSVTLRHKMHSSEYVDCKDKSCSKEMKSLGFLCCLIVDDLIIVLSQGSMDLQRVTSHPVHLIDNNNQTLNPTALVPFCSVSDDYSAMGVKIDQIDVPVCNSFRPKMMRDQLCYTVDLNKIKQQIDFKDTITFSFFIDYNEDRILSSVYDEDIAISKNADGAKDGIIIETIGMHTFLTFFPRDNVKVKVGIGL